MAFRSLGRNRRRSAITAAALTLSVAYVLIGLGLMSGLEEQSANNLIGLDYGHLKVLPSSYDPDLPTYDTLMVLADFPDELFEVEGIEGIAPRLKFPAILSDGLDQFSCLGYGLNLEEDRHVFDLQDAALQGRFWCEGESGIVIGKKLADIFNIAVDADSPPELTVLGRSTLGAIGALDFPVLGIIRTGYPPIDGNGVLMPISSAQRLLNSPDQVSEISVRLSNSAELQNVRGKLQKALDNAGLKVQVLTWLDQAADFLAIHRFKSMGMSIVNFFFVLLAVVGVANSILIAAFERTREVGMLRALGMNQGEIMGQFLCEGAALGLFGSLIGGVLGSAVNLYLQAHGLNLTALYGDMELGYPIKDYLYSHFSVIHLIASIVIATVLSALAAYLPARRTCRLSPSEAIRAQ